MNNEDFIKTINGELWYKSDYAYWLYKQLEDRDNKINKAMEYCEDITSRAIDISDTDYELGEDFTARGILKILRGEDNENNK